MVKNLNLMDQTLYMLRHPRATNAESTAIDDMVPVNSRMTDSVMVLGVASVDAFTDQVIRLTGAAWYLDGWR